MRNQFEAFVDDLRAAHGRNLASVILYGSAAAGDFVKNTSDYNILIALHKITPKDLLATAWVLRERGSGTRSMFEAALRQSGIKPSDLRVALELPSNEAVRTAVEAGGCATAISDLVVAQSLAARTLHRVKFDLPRRSFYVLRHKERHVSRIEQALLKSLNG